MKTVVAIGELLIDFVPQQKGCALDEVVQFERVAGGAPANVATAVARLGGHSRMVSQVGEDAFGTHILKVLNAANVDTSSVFRTNRANTALAFVSLDKTGNREFSFYRNPSADLFLDETQIAPEMFENCAALHFCSVEFSGLAGCVRRTFAQSSLRSKPGRSSRSTPTFACRSGAVRPTVRRRYGNFCRMPTL